jgi:S-adenosylmethionine decarboxylase
MRTFREYYLNRLKGLMLEGEYCEGLSVNCDFFWKEGSDVSFLTTARSDVIVGIMRDAVQAGHMKVFDTRLTKYGPNPEFGFTYYIVLGQSHITIHTWPEHYMMNIDVFTCGSEGDPKAIVDYVRKTLKPHQQRFNQFQRGIRKDVEDVNEKPDRPEDINTHKPTAPGIDNKKSDFIVSPLH